MPENFSQIILSSLGDVITDTITIFAGLLPLALTVFAAVWGVRKAMSFFRTAAK